jgi:hypothetical protein
MSEQERRYACRLIDLAAECCEERNLSNQLWVPRWISDLVVQLQAAAGEELRIPTDTIDAHGELLDRRENYMPRLAESERRTAGATCEDCGEPLSPITKRTTCTRCRQLRRLVERAAAQLAS